ncbi:MAG: HAD family hydrolase [Candidatus Dormibacteraeota bacterium]|nr:HAD family hydrolase [Candidatus Dormibacteraeota bacterium]
MRVDDRDAEALRRARAAGMHVVAVTGRPFPGALPWVRRLGLEEPLVCYQGAQVRTPEGEMLLDHGLPHDLAMEVVRFCRERGLHVQAYRDDQLIVERDRPEAREYANHAGMEIHVVPDLDGAMGATTPKLVVVADAKVVEHLLPEVREHWAGRMYAATSVPSYLEMTNPNADKRQALEFLCRRLGVGREETVAVGDGRNDQPMIEWAGLGYAVEGAPPEVLAAAGGRTIGKPGSGGVAWMVDQLLAG